MYYSSELITDGVWNIIDRSDGIKPYVNVYLVEGCDRALLIDAGDSGADLAGFVRGLRDKPVELLLTHGHKDHAASMRQFKKVYMSHKDISVLAIRPGFENISKADFIDLEDGEVFDLGGCRIEVLAFPGHTPGSVVLLDRARQLLFAGDAMGSGALWMQLPHSLPVEAYVQEIHGFEKRIEGLDAIKVYLGHDCLMGRKPDRQYITDTRIAAEKIVSGELVGVPTEDRREIYGGLTVSYGQMLNFIYKPYNIYIKK